MFPTEKQIPISITDYPSRFLYGSDYPFFMEPLQNGIERILDLGLPADTLDRLFYRNAEQFLQKANCPKKD
jgi:predicted TIM-barrel fold metal-dependent hydrolase